MADTWHAMWQTQPRPDPDLAQVQALTAYQPPLTGGPVVRSWSFGIGLRIYPRGGGWMNGRMTRHRSTRFGNKSILEVDVAQGDWWIKSIAAANDEI
nr:hypothetical protein [Tanacetum cinerariifolium]